ncbi:MAG: GGDEF domain-containing phosphodiesterase [Oceanospirillaceae bacterium]
MKNNLLQSVIDTLSTNSNLQGNEALETVLRNTSLIDLSELIKVDTNFTRDLKFIHKNIRFSIDIQECVLIRQVRGIRWEYKVIISNHKFKAEENWIVIPSQEHSNIETLLSIKMELNNVSPFLNHQNNSVIYQLLDIENAHFENFRYERGGVLFAPSKENKYSLSDKNYLSNIASIISFCVEKDTSSQFLSGVYRNLKSTAKRAQQNIEQHCVGSIPVAYLNENSGLPNQAGFLRLIGHLIDSGETDFSVVVLSIDKFSYFCNLFDAYTKERFLAETIDRISSVIVNNTTLSHIGASDLAFVLLEHDSISVKQKILEVLNSFSEDLQVDDVKVRFEISVGISEYPSCGNNADTLQKMANIALFKASQKTNDRLVIYTQGMEKELKLHLELSRSIQQAIERDELEVYFQPITLVGDKGKVHYYEALVRWIHPQQGIISPDLFIEIAEASGEIIPLGYWITQRVCHHIHRKKLPANICVSINLSPIQIRETKLASNMANILQRYSIAPNRITFEITETAAMLDPTLTRLRFSELKNIGFKLAVDDFGTGYSSLSYLLNFSFEYIKIDKSFIDHSSINDGYAVIASSMIKLAHKLNMIVICEGIETAQQYSMVTDWGADMIQGYLISKPMPIEHFYPD